MPRQNRLTPGGTIVANNSRGMFMGNRGRLHNPGGEVVRLWQSKAWITCLLDFKDRQRKIMTANSYTELFFLDEATAFAAGHRPCGECRRQDFNRFKELWTAANPKFKIGSSIKTIDEILHKERVSSYRKKCVYDDYVQNLPSGTMFALSENRDQYFAINNSRIFKWAANGYEFHPSISGTEQVKVLTPHSIVKTFALGYKAQMHKSCVKITDGINEK